MSDNEKNTEEIKNEQENVSSDGNSVLNEAEVSADSSQDADSAETASKEESSASDNAEKTDAEKSKREVKYETNDNWKFDGDSRSVKDNIVSGNDDFEFEIKEDDFYNKSSAKQKNTNPEYQASNQIVINKEPLKFIPLAIFVAAVIAVLAVLGVRYYTVPNGLEGEMMNPGSVVAEIDDVKVSIGMYNYYYSSVVSYYETYASYGYFDLDTSSDYSEQYTTDDDGEEISWADFFKQEALEEIKSVTTYYAEGVKAGITLTDTQQETIDSQMESLEETASESEVSVNEYIAENYGEYCTEDTLRLMLEQYYISLQYKGMVIAQTEVTDDEIEEYFNENKLDFYQINFSYLSLDYDSTDDDTIAESIETAESYMELMTDEDSVKEIADELYADYITSDAESAMESDDTLTEEEAIADATETYESYTLATIDGDTSPFDDEFNDWLFGDDTEIGSTNYFIDEEYGYIYVILKTEDATLLDDQTYTVRHILISPESEDESEDTDDTDDTETETTYTDEEWATALETANSVLDEYNSGDKTEYSFALLAEEYSADTASTSAESDSDFGGIYETVSEGEMVEEFEDWSLDESRQYGDTDIVQSDYGYHIMYFINAGPQYENEIIVYLKNDKLTQIVDDADIKSYDSRIDNAIEIYNSATETDDTDSTSTDDSSAYYTYE